MVEKVNGRAFGGEFLTGNMQFLTVTTSIDIRTTGMVGASANSQARFDRLIEVVSQRAQPIILGGVTVDESNYVVTFAIEHLDVWTATGLRDALDTQLPDDGYTSGNTSVTLAQTL